MGCTRYKTETNKTEIQDNNVCITEREFYVFGSIIEDGGRI